MIDSLTKGHIDELADSKVSYWTRVVDVKWCLTSNNASLLYASATSRRYHTISNVSYERLRCYHFTTASKRPLSIPSELMSEYYLSPFSRTR